MRRGKFGARLVVRKAWKSGAITREEAKAMLRDDDKLELLIDLASDEIIADESEDGWLLSILKYLLADDGAALKALIAIIMALFAEQAHANRGGRGRLMSRQWVLINGYGQGGNDKTGLGRIAKELARRR